MARATNLVGNLERIEDCYIRVGEDIIYAYVLPTLGDGHQATYNSETGIGRSIPTKTFQSGSDRTISVEWQFFAEGEGKLLGNLYYYRLLTSCTYPVDLPQGASVPFLPPKIVKIKCGRLLGDEELCCVVNSVNVNWPTDGPWSSLEYGYIPYKFSLTINLSVVYNSADLPGAARILSLGR